MQVLSSMSESELREQLSLRSFGKVRKLYKRTRELFAVGGMAGTVLPAGSMTAAATPVFPLGMSSGPQSGCPRLPALSPGVPCMGPLLRPATSGPAAAAAVIGNPISAAPGPAPMPPKAVGAVAHVRVVVGGQDDETVSDTDKNCPGIISQPEAAAVHMTPQAATEVLAATATSAVPAGVTDLVAATGPSDPHLPAPGTEAGQAHDAMTIDDVEDSASPRINGALLGIEASSDVATIASIVSADCAGPSSDGLPDPSGASADNPSIPTILNAPAIPTVLTAETLASSTDRLVEARARLLSDDREVEAQLLAEGSCIGKLHWVVNKKLLPSLKGNRGWGTRELEEARLRELEVSGRVLLSQMQVECLVDLETKADLCCPVIRI